MKLRGIEFENVLSASFVLGFFGEGYWWHKVFRYIPGFDYKSMTFVSKTATAYPHKGNVELKDDFTPCKLFPKVIKFNFFKGTIVNNVGLSNPGILKLLETNKWQELQKPFFISITSIAQTEEERLKEFRYIANLLEQHKPKFNSPFGLQINISCPNKGEISIENFLKEINEIAKILNNLNVPLMIKLGVDTTVENAKEISEIKYIDAICVSNSLPVKGGGLSGKPLFPLVCEWIKEAREIGISKHINAGGGLMSNKDAAKLCNLGADSIFLGSMLALRPWRVKGVMRM